MPAVFARPTPLRATSVRRQDVRANYFGRDKKVVERQKEEMWKAQQEMLAARRAGKSMEGVSERRAEAKEFYRQKDLKKAEERRLLREGIVPPRDPKNLKPYGDEDVGMMGGIPLPMAPFGLPKWDNGERFDLRSPYTDEGWVPEGDKSYEKVKASGVLGWTQNLFGQKEKPAPEETEETEEVEEEPVVEVEQPKKKSVWNMFGKK